jgi:alpha-N-arabinofuranosidase
MLPVTWRDGWPTILAADEAIAYIVAAPRFATASAAGDQLTPTTGNFTWRDDFSSPVLRRQWLYVRTPIVPWVDLTSRPGWLTIHALHVPLRSLQNVSFLARRQQHQSFNASTELEAPGNPGGVSAGLVAFQNEDYWYFLGVRRIPVPGRELESRLEMFLERRAGRQTETVAATALDGAVGRIKLEIVANARDCSFYFDPDGSGWKALQEHADGSILSTDVAGGFVGAMVGPYARAD